MRAVVLVKILLWSTAVRSDIVVRNIANRLAFHRLDNDIILPFDICEEVFVIPNFNRFLNSRRLVNFEFLILGRIGIIKNPLSERNILANKFKKK